MNSDSEFEFLFKAAEAALGDPSNAEFHVIAAEASPAEARSIDELRRLAMNVRADVGVTFMSA